MDVGKGLCDDGRRGKTCEEEKVAAMHEGEDKLHCHTVHVGHGQDAKYRRALLDACAEDFETEVEVAPNGTIGQHHALGESGGAAGVVNDSQFLGLVFMIAYVLRAEGAGESSAEYFIKMFACVGEFIRS